MKYFVTEDIRLKHIRIDVKQVCVATISMIVLLFGLAFKAFGVPETTSVRVTDVSTSSFSVVWMTDVAAEPSVEVYSDSAMTAQLTDHVLITPMPARNQETVQAARNKGIMKVRVSGLSPATQYFVRTVTKDPVNSSSVAYSPTYGVTTAATVIPYRYINGEAKGFSNDLLSFKGYIRPLDNGEKPGLGNLILLEADGSGYPLSAFIGEGINAPEGILDLNNLFGNDGLSLDLIGTERAILRIYRGGGLSTLAHYRRVPQDGDMVYVVEPVKGFFADINLDGSVDDADFAEFKKQYRTLPDDASYNPDFDFVGDPEGKVDAKEFSRFSGEYGRTNVE